jgi:hypothetical protein
MAPGIHSGNALQSCGFFALIRFYSIAQRLAATKRNGCKQHPPTAARAFA